MKYFLTFCLVLACYLSYAQITFDEYEKYWYYRHRLTTEFMVQGEAPIDCSSTTPYGYSLPAHSTYSHRNDDGDYMIYWSDGTTDLGYYLGVLATEYRLLADYGWNTDQTLKELYWAMKALERLDRKSAVPFYNDGTCHDDYGNVGNGYFIRDDVFIEPGGGSDIFANNPIFDQYKIGNEYDYRSDFKEIKDREWTENNGKINTVTTDQVLHLFEGLLLVKKCTDGVTYNGYNFRQRAMDIAHNITQYLSDHRWLVVDEYGHPPGNALNFWEGNMINVAKAAGNIVDYRSSRNYLRSLPRNVRFQQRELLRVLVRGIKDGWYDLWFKEQRDFTISHILSGLAVGNTFNTNLDEEALEAAHRWTPINLGYYELLNYYTRNKNGMNLRDLDVQLRNAPCYGIVYRPVNSVITDDENNIYRDYYFGEDGWLGSNRWVRFLKRNRDYESTYGIKLDHHKGHGLDYMILYNLFLLYNKDRNPGMLGTLQINPPPAYYLKIDQPKTLIPYVESYNTIEISAPIAFSSFYYGNRTIVANQKITLKPGFALTAETDHIITIQIRGNVNACGDKLDEFGELIIDGSSGGRIASASSDAREQLNKYQPVSRAIDREENYLTVEDNTYKSLDDYLNERNQDEKGGELFTMVNVYPNPGRLNNLTIMVDSNMDHDFSIQLFDATGLQIKNFGEYYVKKGLHQIDLGSNENIKSGIYFIMIQSDNYSKVIKQIFR